jgi:hypothetical protein
MNRVPQLSSDILTSLLIEISAKLACGLSRLLCAELILQDFQDFRPKLTSLIIKDLAARTLNASLPNNLITGKSSTIIF